MIKILQNGQFRRRNDNFLDKVLSNLICLWLALPGGTAVSATPLLRDLAGTCGDSGGAPVVLALGFAQVQVHVEVSLPQENHQPLLV